MKKTIRILLIDTCGWIASTTIVIFFFTLWLFSYNNVESPLKESWSIAFSSLSALATLGAAIVAAKLFNDWKDQEEYKLYVKFIENITNDCITLISELRLLAFPISKIKNGIKILIKAPENTEFTSEKIDKWVEENFEERLHKIKHFKSLINNIDRYTKYNKDQSLIIFKNSLILSFTKYSSFRLLDIKDLEKSKEDAEGLLLMITELTKKIETDLLPFLDEMNSPVEWNKRKINNS